MGNSSEIESINLGIGQDSDMEGKYLTFLLEQQLFSIPICHVVQIVSMQEISEIPESVHYLKGVINLRGSIIPVIDMNLRLGKEEKAYDDRTCIIVVSIEEQEIGFIVSEVDAVVSIAEEDVSVPPQIADNKNQNYLSGIAKLDGKVALIMNTSKMLAEDALMTIQDVV